MVQFGAIALFLVLGISGVISQNESCRLPNNEEGECKNIKQCQFAIDQLRNERKKPVTCSFNGNLPIVCCPKETTDEITDLKSYGRIAKQKCEEIKNEHPQKYSSYVVGGVDAKPTEYVHMAALGYGEYKTVEWYCGGTLISNKFVLTAAHCLHSQGVGPVRWVRLGDLDLVNTNDTAEPVDFEVVRRIRHPDYRPPSKYNDIALLEIGPQTVQYTEYIKPACINTASELPSDVLGVLATGWGLIDLGGTRSNHLQEVELQVFPNDECRQSYAVNRRNLANGIIESQMCAGSRFERKDTCNGDSGGPLQHKNLEPMGYSYRGYTVVGVTSFGKLCGIVNSPGVYTRVYSYVPWIESIVWTDTTK